MIDHTTTVLFSQRPGHRLLTSPVIEDLRGGGETLDMSDSVGEDLALTGPPDDVVTPSSAPRPNTPRLTFLQTFQGRPGLRTPPGHLWKYSFDQWLRSECGLMDFRIYPVITLIN